MSSQPTATSDSASPAGSAAPLLVARGIEKHFDGVFALRGASLEIAPGEVHVLMGENGAGKSTLAKVIAGVVRPDAGEIAFCGQPVRLRSPLEARTLGIGIVFQELDLFPHLSVAENIIIGNAAVERSAFVNRSAMRKFCSSFLAQVGFSLPTETMSRELSVGQTQLVAIARALSMDAKLILMDEPTSALGDEDVARLFGLIRKLTSRGVSIVYVSHKLQEIFQIADRITIMRDGTTIGTRRARETDIRQIITMMVGRELAEATPRSTLRQQTRLLNVRSLTTSKLRDVSFELNAGEVLGVAGLVGAGRSELGAALFGRDPITGGTLELKGQPFRPKNVRQAISRGLGLVPEDRKGQGLMMRMSVKDNCTASVLPRLASGGFIRGADERERARSVLEQTRIKTASYDAPVSSLSGGNQQKVLLGRWLAVDPDVLFLNDPTRGIDVGAKRDIYAIIAALAARGKGILFVSSELPELLLNCDRILVLHDGRLMGCVEARSTTQEHIMAMATRTAADQPIDSP